MRALSSYYRCAIDEHAFDNIDAQKAWMLGYLWADGSLLWPRRYAGHMLVVASVDQWIPEMFKTVLKSDGAIHEVQRGHLSPNQHNLFRFSPAALRYLGPKLEGMGMARYKSERTPPVGLPQELIKDFIRGIFDADGSVGMYGKNQQPTACIVGYIPMLSWVKNQLAGNITKMGNCFRLQNGSRQGVIDWCNYLYYSECLCLERKRLKFVEIQMRYSSYEKRRGAWTEEETTTIIKCRRLHIPPREIVLHLRKESPHGRTVAAVSGKLHKLGL